LAIEHRGVILRTLGRTGKNISHRLTPTRFGPSPAHP
jgi:hypothetical protein